MSGLARICTTAGMVSTSVAIRTRTSTAAPGVQPTRIRLVAKDPEVPNVAAESTASASPTSVRTRDSTAPAFVMTQLWYAHYAV